MESYKESRFSRSAWNVKKLGAYYTDPDHARRIGNLFDFDTAQEICVLEPSIGDGRAVLETVGKRKNVKTYGVEIQEETYRSCLADNDNFTCILNEDFLRGVKISHGSFSFCFANPPYGEQKEDEQARRLERLFLDRIGLYLKTGAYLAFILPFYVFTEEKMFRRILEKYEICGYYRFDDEVYKKFNQIVVILKKKRNGGYLRSVFEEEYHKALKIQDYPYLPDGETALADRYHVLESRDEDIEYFTTKEFRPKDAAGRLACSPLFDMIGENMFQKPYRGCRLNNPILPVSKDIAYLLSVTGGGQGFAGKEGEGTLHLQRGVAMYTQEEQTNWSKEGEAESITETSYTKIQMCLIENDGKITRF